MSNKLLQQLEGIKETIESSKNKKATIQGKIESIMERLKKEFACDTIEDATKLLKKLKSTIEKDETELKDGIEKLQDAFEWDSI